MAEGSEALGGSEAGEAEGLEEGSEVTEGWGVWGGLEVAESARSQHASFGSIWHQHRGLHVRGSSSGKHPFRSVLKTINACCTDDEQASLLEQKAQLTLTSGQQSPLGQLY